MVTRSQKSRMSALLRKYIKNEAEVRSLSRELEQVLDDAPKGISYDFLSWFKDPIWVAMVISSLFWLVVAIMK